MYACKAFVQKLSVVQNMKAKELRGKRKGIIRKVYIMANNLAIVKLIRWIRAKAGDADGTGNHIRKRNRC